MRKATSLARPRELSVVARSHHLCRESGMPEGPPAIGRHLQGRMGLQSQYRWIEANDGTAMTHGGVMAAWMLRASPLGGHGQGWSGDCRRGERVVGRPTANLPSRLPAASRELLAKDRQSSREAVGEREMLQQCCSAVQRIVGCGVGIVETASTDWGHKRNGLCRCEDRTIGSYDRTTRWNEWMI